MNSVIADLSPIKGALGIVELILMAVAAHALVIFIRRLGTRVVESGVDSKLPKTRSIASLATSVVVFCVYFTVIGLILKRFGLSITTYLASASVIGLAIGFGSQGVVQDVMTGLTLIFSDLLDIGDMVEISGQTGIVRGIGMRFTVLENALGAQVAIPNRTISNIVTYPRGYVRCLVDVTLAGNDELAERMASRITELAQGAFEQFPGIVLTPPSVEGRHTTTGGRRFLRLKFRIWPGRGAPLETSLKQEITGEMKTLDPAYADWMVMVYYEIEEKTVRPSHRHARKSHRAGKPRAGA